MKNENFVIGIDFGTDSVRCVIVDASDAEEISQSVCHYSRWYDGKYCDPAANKFRQHPLDYIEGLEKAIKGALKNCPNAAASKIRGIGVDTTGSTPAPVDKNGAPLSLNPAFEHNPNAMFVLWKDHTAAPEAQTINKIAKSWGGKDFTEYEGGVYSSEWFWSKILHILKEDETIRNAAFSWVEHCDWIPALLTGAANPLTMKRSRCAAGHKAMWHASFGGLPPEKFLVAIDPLLAGLRARLFTETYTSDAPAGKLTGEWAARLGLPADTVVGVGAFDAHFGAVGGGIKPYILTKVIGTSTCDMLIAPSEEMGGKLIRGICGQVDGSIIPGMLGMEAGQSAFGDVYAWFRDVLMWPIENVIGKMNNETMRIIHAEVSDKIIDALSREAESRAIDPSGVLALDWLNGRRTPDANQLLKGALTGLNLGSDAPAIFRALVEATAFGARRIVERFRSEGVAIEGVIALGGIPKKSPFIMQTVSDVLNMPVKVSASDQACALGAAMFAAVAGGIYPTVETAQDAMSSGFDIEYKPIRNNAEQYERIYRKYNMLGEFIETNLT